MPVSRMASHITSLATIAAGESYLVTGLATMGDQWCKSGSLFDYTWGGT